MVMPKRDPLGHRTSRDYSLPVIDCDVVCCPCCVNDKCTMPSVITINSDGRCEMAKKSFNRRGMG
jgi:hypothetical protein